MVQGELHRHLTLTAMGELLKFVFISFLILLILALAIPLLVLVLSQFRKNFLVISSKYSQINTMDIVSNSQ